MAELKALPISNEKWYEIDDKQDLDIAEVDFEGKKYPALKEYDNYLRYQYGDYMQLPPKEKQVAHHYQCFLTDAQD